ncbi:MAG: hypothetical protein N2V78_00655 [Methanophagales archaeon]|nr:hypothetical protein [Methanophagales archaeon]
MGKPDVRNFRRGGALETGLLRIYTDKKLETVDTDIDGLRLLRQCSIRQEIARILQNPTTPLNPVLKVGNQIGEVIPLYQGLDKRTAKEKVIEMLESVKYLRQRKGQMSIRMNLAVE